MTSFRWIKNGSSIMSDGKILFFSSLTLSDAGQYICDVIEDMNSYYNSTNIVLKSEYLIN